METVDGILWFLRNKKKVINQGKLKIFDGYIREVVTARWRKLCYWPQMSSDSVLSLGEGKG